MATIKLTAKQYIHETQNENAKQENYNPCVEPLPFLTTKALGTSRSHIMKVKQQQTRCILDIRHCYAGESPKTTTKLIAYGRNYGLSVNPSVFTH